MSPSSQSATVPATPTACCCAGACRWSKSRFSSACGSNSRRPPIDRVRYGASAGHPALGAAEYTRVRAGRQSRSLHVLHVRGRLRDAQRERSRLLLHQRHEREPPRFAFCQQRAGRHDRARRRPAAPIRLRECITSSDSNGSHIWRRADRTKHPCNGLAIFLPAGRAEASIPTSYRRGGPRDGSGALPARRWSWKPS